MTGKIKDSDLVDTIRFGGADDVRVLLDAYPLLDLKGAASPEVTSSGQTYLMIACEQTDLPQADKVVSLLLERGADTEARNEYGKQAIHYVSERGASAKMFKTLLAAGADIDSLCTSDGTTPLHFAARKKDLDSIEFLLEAGADSRITDDAGKDALEYLSASLNITAIEKLDANKVPPRVAIDDDLTRKALITQEDGVNALDAGVLWLKSDKLFAQLEANGEGLDKGDVMAAGKNGKRIATRAFEFDGGAHLVKHLNKQGITLGVDDLLDASGKPNDLLTAAVEHGQAASLFTEANWRGMNTRDMRKTYDAMPAEGKEQVGGVQRLQLLLQSERVELQGIGR